MSRHIAAHLTTVADVLQELAGEIEMLGTTLCMDADVLGRHIGTLQSIDLIAQKQRWLATLLQADCPLDAVDTIGVETLKARFAPAPSHGAASDLAS
ncbi:MAG: hypothetical protein KGJ57_05655 [Sphingomonadales bacterium]|nr:hypothetical protein [Sphingomonadales bacterium]MDE2168903.1 hypothetical protein [Sphingomonadales bacterium]